jgi:hypothetical protein
MQEFSDIQRVPEKFLQLYTNSIDYTIELQHYNITTSLSAQSFLGHPLYGLIAFN